MLPSRRATQAACAQEKLVRSRPPASFLEICIEVSFLGCARQAENCFSESLALCPDYPDAIKWREKLADVKVRAASQASRPSPGSHDSRLCAA